MLTIFSLVCIEPVLGEEPLQRGRRDRKSITKVSKLNAFKTKLQRQFHCVFESCVLKEVKNRI